MDKNQLRQVLTEQQHEFTVRQLAARPRQQLVTIKELINQSSLAKVILGIRRSGKSTLGHQALVDDESAYVNFDDERLVGLDISDLQQVLEIAKELKPNVRTYFFDEIQNIDGWELFINRLQRTHHNLIISGSNGKLLGSDLATHLTGRQVSLNVYPLSFPEFITWRDSSFQILKFQETVTGNELARLNQYFTEYFVLGGFPEVVLGEPQGIYLRELFDKIVGRDIVQRHKIREVRKLKEVAAYLLQNSAQIISYKNIKNAFGISSLITTQKYVELLEDAFLVHQLRGYSYKLKERSTSRKKIYACDLGMIQALWTKPTPDRGAKFETLVFLHLLRERQEIYYLHHDAREVDFCVVKDGKITDLIQACYDLSNEKTRDREFKALVNLGEKFKVANLLVVTRDQEQEVDFQGRKIRLIPIVKYLLMNNPY